MESLNQDLFYYLVDFLEYPDFINLLITNKLYYQWLVSQRYNKVHKYCLTQTKKIIPKIINTYNHPKVKGLEISCIDLWDDMSNIVDLIKKYKKIYNSLIASKHTIDNKHDNNIIECFQLVYKSHYDEKERMFTLMSMDKSFVVSVMMYIYH